ncbi:hypothetical protein E1267_17730 [Nonomuraea longispora]|uniref:Altered inheritance of mitochondria protein 6 n=1 Tax=Nonomuraea longispora TaxID=1848320 RepID=A0A4R4NEW4_9ACTN|nr:phosphatidylinositol-specific phospholipase C/glycerophosphodiester phosphodiesterase family protein [Nonomuraea longispora]TDC06050.1 hypothetical protein E1267_17730 [Nonomuraea longispora]
MLRRTLGVLVAAGTMLLAAAPAQAAGRPEPLPRAHAHNDYEHERPLLDALDHGFTSVEADIYLVDGELRVGHDPEDLRPGRTLQSLYLDPLIRRARHGSVFPGTRQPLQLLVDVKNNGEATYTELDRVLKAYKRMLTTYHKGHKGRVRHGAVTVVVSGERPRELMAGQERRYAFYDGRMDDLGQGDPGLIPLISDNWTNHFSWLGEGEMPAAERAKLRRIVATAHRDGQRVRFWATPDTAGPARDALWRELVAADVDHLNTDDLAGLRDFLRENDRERAAA